MPLLTAPARPQADKELTNLIRRKFAIKCTTGYSLNALVGTSQSASFTDSCLFVAGLLEASASNRGKPGSLGSCDGAQATHDGLSGPSTRQASFLPCSALLPARWTSTPTTPSRSSSG